MILRLWQSLRERRERSALRRRAIPDDLWKRTLVRYPFLQRRDAADAAELRRLTSLFLDRKEFDAAGGLKLTDAVVVAIAAQAVLPVLRLGLARYDGFVGIVVHPDQVVARREVADEDGVVHQYHEVLAGEAMEGGPVMLSWRDVRSAGAAPGAAAYNVVIHEFAHVLDMADGLSDGVPVLPPELPRHEWTALLRREHADFVQLVERADAAGDDEALDALVLDPYAATGEDEFFAVASEAFFVAPQALRDAHPHLYTMFTRFYRQDPAAETATPRASAGR
ncbi:MAG: zinc-dependent peptidase [Rubrivivax sp.]|nr:zinc-dependent peptidase [Rubrivivax sp.]